MVDERGAPCPDGGGTFEVSSDPETEILTIRFRGPLSAELVRRALESYSSDRGGFAVARRLWDLRFVDEVRLTAAEIQAVARRSQERDRDTPGRLALLVSDDLSYGLARIHQAFRESDVTAQQIFRDEARARAWLLA